MIADWIFDKTQPDATKNTDDDGGPSSNIALAPRRLAGGAASSATRCLAAWTNAAGFYWVWYGSELGVWPSYAAWVCETNVIMM